MKILNDILADLVEKKLWLPAALLVIAIVGVPMQLAKPGDAPPPPAVPTAAVQQETGPELALTRAVKTGFDRAPRVNKKSSDPFGERNDDQVNAALKALRKKLLESLKSTISGDTSGGGTSLGGGTSDGGGVVPEAPKDDSSGGDGGGKTPSSKPEIDDLLSIMVTVNDGMPQQVNDIRTLSPLPDTTNPFLVYTGKNDSGAAVFIVSADVQPTGEGKCDPTPENCQTLTLGEGQTEDFKILTSSEGTVSITVIGIETKEVKTDGPSATAARLEAKARKLGATVVRDALDNPFILKSLADQKVKIRP